MEVRRSASVDGIVAFPMAKDHGHSFGPDVDQLRRTLGGVLNHPNVGAALIPGLGCEVNRSNTTSRAANPAPDRLTGSPSGQRVPRHDRRRPAHHR